MVNEVQPRVIEQKPRVKDFQKILRGFKKAFSGYAAVPAMFALVPIRDESLEEVVDHPNGRYVVQRGDFASLGSLSIVIKRTTVNSDDLLVSETVTLKDGTAEDITQGELDNQGKAKLTRRISFKYEKIEKISAEEIEKSQEQAKRNGEKGISQIQVVLTTTTRESKDLEALADIEGFMQQIAEGNPNLMGRITRRGKV